MIKNTLALMLIRKKFESKVDFKLIRVYLFLNYKQNKLRVQVIGEHKKAEKEMPLSEHSEITDMIKSNLKKYMKYDKLDFIDIVVNFSEKKIGAKVYYELNNEPLKFESDNVLK